MAESKSKFQPELKFDTETVAEGAEINPDQRSWVQIRATPAFKMHFLSLLVANDLTLGNLLGVMGRRAARSFEDQEAVKRAFRDFLIAIDPRRFKAQTLSKKNSRRQDTMSAMFKEIQEKEQGWSQDEIQKLYKLFEETQEELTNETD